jgi:hypothetical protein
LTYQREKEREREVYFYGAQTHVLEHTPNSAHMSGEYIRITEPSYNMDMQAMQLHVHTTEQALERRFNTCRQRLWPRCAPDMFLLTCSRLKMANFSLHLTRRCFMAYAVSGQTPDKAQQLAAADG